MYGDPERFTGSGGPGLKTVTRGRKSFTEDELSELFDSIEELEEDQEKFLLASTFLTASITEFYNSCHGEDGRFCETHGVTHSIQKAAPGDLAATKAQVAQKVVDAPVPSAASVKRARALANVSLGSQNSADRRRQRENLFKEFGGEERGYVVDHQSGVKMHWTNDSNENPNQYPLFERGRIFTERQGGSYRLENLLPELYDTNRARGDRPIRKENT